MKMRILYPSILLLLPMIGHGGLYMDSTIEADLIEPIAETSEEKTSLAALSEEEQPGVPLEAAPEYIIDLKPVVNQSSNDEKTAIRSKPVRVAPQANSMEDAEPRSLGSNMSAIALICAALTASGLFFHLRQIKD